MCHAVRVRLSPEERAEARRLTRLLVPVYAAVVLAIVAVATLTSAPRTGDMIAAASTPVAAPR
jgi:hypothetical protein